MDGLRGLRGLRVTLVLLLVLPYGAPGAPFAPPDEVGPPPPAGALPRGAGLTLHVTFVRSGAVGAGLPASLDLEGAYARLAAFLASGGVRLVASEAPVAPAQPLREAPSLVVLLEPQRAQPVPHSGVAWPERGVAAVDLGFFVRTSFAFGSATWELTPALETHLAAGHEGLARQLGFRGGGVAADGRVFVELHPAGAGASLRWRGPWFAEPPRLVRAAGSEAAGVPISVHVEEEALARTLAHELGHLLGLCHAGAAGCDAAADAPSVMHPPARVLALQAGELARLRAAVAARAPASP